MRANGISKRGAGGLSVIRPGNPKEWSPHFTGVTVLNGQRHWVNIYKKKDLNGDVYLSVQIKPWKEEQ
jgi:hypothetical protein